MLSQAAIRRRAVACPTSPHGQGRLTLSWLCVRTRGGIVVVVSEPKPTVVMRRDDLLDLVDATAQRGVAANTIPRSVVDRRNKVSGAKPIAIAPSVAEDELDDDIDASASPLAILAVLGMFIALFIALVQLD